MTTAKQIHALFNALEKPSENVRWLEGVARYLDNESTRGSGAANNRPETDK